MKVIKFYLKNTQLTIEVRFKVQTQRQELQDLQIQLKSILETLKFPSGRIYKSRLPLLSLRI